MTELSREEVLRIAQVVSNDPGFLIDFYSERMISVCSAIYEAGAKSSQSDGWRQCAKGQHTSQFCGQLEAAVAAERAVSDRLLEALKFWKIAADNAEECEFDDMAAFSVPMPLFCDADEATDAAIAEVEAMRKEKPE